MKTMQDRESVDLCGGSYKCAVIWCDYCTMNKKLRFYK